MSNTTITVASLENKTVGDEISVAISINTASPGSISALDLSFKFDENQLEPLPAVATAGELTNAWGAPVAHVRDGTIKVSQASSSTLYANSGEILILHFKIKEGVSGTIQIDLDENQSSIMEGDVEFTATDGVIVLASTANTAPTPTSTPQPTPAPTSAPSSESSADVSGMNADDVASLTPEVVSEFSADQLSNLPSVAVLGLTADLVSELAIDAVPGFTQQQIKQMSADAVAALSKAQVSELSTQAVKGFTADQMAQMPKRIFKALESDQLAKLSKDAVTGLTSSQLKTLSGDELATFKPRKIKAISAESISGLRPAALDDLRKRQVRAFTKEQLSGLTMKQIKRADDFVAALLEQQREALAFAPARNNRLMDPLDDQDNPTLLPGLDLEPLA